MPDLFGEPIPIRVVLHVNMDRGHGRFDWDGFAQNPDTGDVLAIHATVARLRASLGPELSRMLLWTERTLRTDGPPAPVEEGPEDLAVPPWITPQR